MVGGTGRWNGVRCVFTVLKASTQIDEFFLLKHVVRSFARTKSFMISSTENTVGSMEDMRVSSRKTLPETLRQTSAEGVYRTIGKRAACDVYAVAALQPCR